MTQKILILGATSAIAQEVAQIYATKQAQICLIGRNPESLNIIAQDLKVRGAGECTTLCADLNDLSTHPALIESAFQAHGTFDVVLLAHGVLGSQDQADHDPTHVVELLQTNFVSYASLLTCVAPHLKAQGKGTIAVLSSVAGDRGKQSNFTYGSAQAGKSAFTDGLRNRLFPYGVHVITFKLGFVDTPMTASFQKGLLWAKPQSVAQGITHAIEKRRDTVYLPFFWKWIMMIIIHIPEFIFKKLKL